MLNLGTKVKVDEAVNLGRFSGEKIREHRFLKEQQNH